MIPLTQFELARALYARDDNYRGFYGGAFEDEPESIQSEFFRRADSIIEDLNQHGVTLTAKGD